MNISLVRLHRDSTHRLHADEHLGLAYIAAALRDARHDVRIFDSALIPLEVIKCDTHLAKSRIIGLTVDVENIEDVISFSKVIRSHDRIVCWGGHHATLCAEQMLADDLCDVVTLGDADTTIQQLAFAVGSGQDLSTIRGIAYRYNDEIISTGPPVLPKELDLLPLPSRDVLSDLSQHDGERAARILSTRGCPYDCTYCTTPAMRRLIPSYFYRQRSAQAVVDEMQKLYRLYGITEFYINDDTYFVNSNSSKTRAALIASLIKETKLHVRYKVELRADSFNAEEDIPLLAHLHSSGLATVFLGFESGSDNMLQSLNKRTTVEQNISAVLALRHVGIRVNIGRILFGPDTTWIELSQSIRSLHQVQASWQIFRHPGMKLRVFPGTTLAKSLRDQGRIDTPLGYRECEYTFRDESIGAFCHSLESSFTSVWPLVQPIVASRSFAGVPVPIEQALEHATFSFLMHIIRRGKKWSDDLFEKALKAYLSRLREVVSDANS